MERKLTRFLWSRCLLEGGDCSRFRLSGQNDPATYLFTTTASHIHDAKHGHMDFYPWQWWWRILCNIWLKWDNKPRIDYWIYDFVKYNNVARGKCLPSNTTVRKVPGSSNWNKNVIWNPYKPERVSFLMYIIGSCNLSLLHCLKSVMKVHVFYILWNFSLCF